MARNHDFKTRYLTRVGELRLSRPVRVRLQASRGQRTCDCCGSAIEPGDLYLYAPAATFGYSGGGNTFCQDCLEES